MDMTAFDQAATTYVELWVSQSAEDRARVTEAIRPAGLMAIWVFDHLPPSEESNDRNELAFALTVPPGGAPAQESGGTNLSALADEARERAETWIGAVMEARADVLRDIHKDGKLAIWVYDHLPPDDESRTRHELIRSLISLADILEKKP